SDRPAQHHPPGAGHCPAIAEVKQRGRTSDHECACDNPADGNEVQTSGNEGNHQMTTLCGGGTSSPKFDTQAITTMSLGAIFQLLSKYEAPWLIPASAMLSLVPLEMATFCGTDPPAISNLTTAEATALLQLDFGTDFYNALGKFKNIVLQMMW